MTTALPSPIRRRLQSLFLLLLFQTWLGVVLGGEDKSAPPQPRIREAMQAGIEAKEIAGAVTLVADREKILHLEALGLADLTGKTPMRPDTIFWIASMTKPITATAVMMLQDDGKLKVDEAVEKYLPELAGLELADGQPARVTIRHLLTHTSGLAEASPEQEASAGSLADLIPAYASQPLRFAPGSRWAYCQSSINTAARIVEVASGLAFTDFLARRLFSPLGMADTTFYLSAEQLPRLARSYRKTPDSGLLEAGIFLLHGKSPASRDRFPAANGGLFSTALDYGRFCRMILARGEFEGKRYLKPESVELMTSLQTGDLQTGFTPGNGWGLGWCVVREPQGVTAALSPKSFGHGGAYGTQAWIDPLKERIYILMVQRANFPNADASSIREAFQKAAAGL